MTERHDIYGPVHKGLRFALSELTIRLGNADWSNEEAAAILAADLRHQLELSRAHLRHEEDHIHPKLRQVAADQVSILEGAHRDHVSELDEIERTLRLTESATEDAAKATLGRELYARFTSFVARDFVHMAEEEAEALPLLHRHFEDHEIAAMEGAIVATLSPEENIAFIRLMTPAMTAQERVRFYAFLQDTLPGEAFDTVLGACAKATLASADWTELAEELAARRVLVPA